MSAGSTGDLPEVILHIGTTKTGTSALQQFCRDNAEVLAEHGIFYPRSPGNLRHYKLNLYLLPPTQAEASLRWNNDSFRDPATFRRRLRRNLIDEVGEAKQHQILLSDEALYAKTRQQQQRLHKLLVQFSRSSRIVVYLRRQDEHLVSRYQQEVKQGLPVRLREYLPQARAWKYDYHAQLAKWRRNLGPTDIVVRRYEPDAFHGGSLHTDFLHALGVEIDVNTLTPPRTKNTSLDAETTEFVRLLNLYQIECRGAKPESIDNRRWLARVREQAPHGPTLTLPDTELDEFMALWEESNRRVATQLMGEKNGVLFRGQRRQGTTQTEQRMDPDRMEHYFEMLEIPEEWQRPLRVIAEREARSP